MKYVDTKIYQILEKVFDIIYINFLFIVFSLPVITMFPAFLAAIDALCSNPMEGETIIKKFIKSFGGYLKQSIIVSVNISFLVVLDVIFYLTAVNSGNLVYLVLASIIVFESIILIVGLGIGFINHETCSLGKRYMNAIVVGHTNFFPILISILLIIVLGVATYIFLPLLFVDFAILIFIMNKTTLKWSDLNDEYYI